MPFHALNFFRGLMSGIRTGGRLAESSNCFRETRLMIMSVNDDREDVYFVLVIYICKAWSETLWLG